MQTQVAFSAPVPASPPPPPAPVVLDIFSQISSTQHYQSPKCVVGPYSLCWDPDDDRVGDPGGQNSLFTYAATLGYTQDLTGYASLQCYLGFGTRYRWCLEYPGHVHGVRVYVDLYDSSGHSVTAHRENMRLPVAPVWTTPAFSRISLPVPQGVTSFDYTSVVSYKITIANRHFPRRLSWVTAYVDNLSAQPPSVTSSPVSRGAVHVLHGVQGTARVPDVPAGHPAAVTRHPDAGHHPRGQHLHRRRRGGVAESRGDRRRRPRVHPHQLRGRRRRRRRRVQPAKTCSRSPPAT